jgi:5-methyltetrahydrofolate--homocysteine methyltransferase
MNIIDFIKNNAPVLLDGAMGTQLEAAGLEGSAENNLTHPDAVLSVHKKYLEAGSELIITNTFAMNRIYIQSHGIDVSVTDVNIKGVELAKQAVSFQGVLGDIASTGQMLQPYGEYTQEQFIQAFSEQAKLLADAGVNGFIIETMMDINEAVCAVKACKEFNLPIFSSIAFQTINNGGRTLMGNSAQECATALLQAGADVIGTNCGDLDPEEMAQIVSIIKDTVDVPIIIQPNAGKPELINGKSHFKMTPEDFTKGINSCIKAGADIVGGCCGTGPEHIRQIAELINKEK